MSTSPEPYAADKKRKRDIVPEDEDDKLEIDVNLPEPPSKKAKRKEKKQSKSSKLSKSKTDQEYRSEEKVEIIKAEGDVLGSKPKASTSTIPPAKHSEYGIWIGNLPFSATKDSLRRFMLNEGDIKEDNITRVHLPTGEKGKNKGFAYIDFTTSTILETALALTERMLEGRSVLIKNAKSFEGRPQKSAAEEYSTGNISKKEPSKRIFVGNLSFDVTKEELAEHFSQAGQVEDVFLATFEDSGKCKGFGWVRFENLDAAKAAVRGFIFKEGADHTEQDDEDEVIEEGKRNIEKQKQKKPQKWFVNRLHGRPLRCEFAEDAQTRYKKRFSKGNAANTTAPARIVDDEDLGAIDENFDHRRRQTTAAKEIASKKKDPNMKRLDKDQRQEERRKKHDARMIAPGKALANTQRASGAIVAGAGNKVTFD